MHFDPDIYTPADDSQDVVDILPSSPLSMEESHFAVSVQLAPVHIRMMEEGHLGFEMVPYSPEDTAIQIKAYTRKMLDSWLKLGAYLYRAKLHMDGKGGAFWTWFDEQEFSFSRRWAYDSINGARAFLSDPNLRKVTRQIGGSIKKLQVVARRLATPEGQAEFEDDGTILGAKPEEIDGIGLRRLQEKAKAADELRKKNEKLKDDLAEKTKVLAETQATLLQVTNPDLHTKEVRKAYMKDLMDAKCVCFAKLENIRPMRRRGMDELGADEVFTLLSVAIALEKEVYLLLREIETTFGSTYKSLLFDHKGTFVRISDMREIRLCQEEANEARGGAQAALDGRPFTIVNKRTDETIYPVPPEEEEEEPEGESFAEAFRAGRPIPGLKE